jgi:hypothetical protein
MMSKQTAGMVIVMVSFVTTRLKMKKPELETEPNPILYALRNKVEQHRQQTLNAIYNSTDGECLSMLRMTRAPFFALCNPFRERSLVCEREGCTIEEQVAMFLHVLHVVGHNQKFRVVHQSFRRSIEAVHKYFHQVLYAVGELTNEMIKPHSNAIHLKVLGSYRWNPYIQGNCKAHVPAFGRCTYSHVLPSHLYAF